MTALCLCTLTNLGVAPEHGADPWSDRAPSSDVVRIVLLCPATLSWPHASIMIYMWYITPVMIRVSHMSKGVRKKNRKFDVDNNRRCAAGILSIYQYWRPRVLPVYKTCQVQTHALWMQVNGKAWEDIYFISYLQYHIHVNDLKSVKCVLCCCLQKSSLNMLPVHVLQI